MLVELPVNLLSALMALCICCQIVVPLQVVVKKEETLYPLQVVVKKEETQVVVKKEDGLYASFLLSIFIDTKYLICR